MVKWAISGCLMLLAIAAAATMFGGAVGGAAPATQPADPKADARAAARAARQAYVGQPMTITGTLIDGKAFSTQTLLPPIMPHPFTKIKFPITELLTQRCAHEVLICPAIRDIVLDASFVRPGAGRITPTI